MEKNIGQSFKFHPDTGKIQFITKEEYCSIIRHTFPLQPSLYMNKTYKEIVKNLSGDTKILKEFTPKMYSFCDDKHKDIIICSLGKTLEDFRKYCKKHNVKLEEDFSTTNTSKKVLSENKVKEIIHDLTECFINDQYPDNIVAGIKKEIDELKYNYAFVIQDSIKTQYGVDVPITKLKEYLKQEFKNILKRR